MVPDVASSWTLGANVQAANKAATSAANFSKVSILLNVLHMMTIKLTFENF